MIALEQQLALQLERMLNIYNDEIRDKEFSPEYVAEVLRVTQELLDKVL